MVRIFADKISWMAYNEAGFQLKVMLSSEFKCTKFLLQIDHLQIFRIYSIDNTLLHHDSRGITL